MDGCNGCIAVSFQQTPQFGLFMEQPVISIYIYCVQSDLYMYLPDMDYPDFFGPNLFMNINKLLSHKLKAVCCKKFQKPAKSLLKTMCS